MSDSVQNSGSGAINSKSVSPSKNGPNEKSHLKSKRSNATGHLKVSFEVAKLFLTIITFSIV